MAYACGRKRRTVTPVSIVVYCRFGSLVESGVLYLKMRIN